MEYELLKKTEMIFEGIKLSGANLNDIAAASAEVMGFERHEVLVTDYQDGRLTIDVLRSSADAHRLFGREEELLRRLGAVPGVEVEHGAVVRSEGMLGWVALDAAKAAQALERAEVKAEEIRARVSRRAVIFSTGREVGDGGILDTNRPAIAARLRQEGYEVAQGPTLEDDRPLITAALRRAAEEGGFGLVVTTGGVGAEAKDHTVEAVLSLDPSAATPYICRFEVGTGRHHKDGVRIAVGEYGGTTIVSLPGPNDEVLASLDVLAVGLRLGLDKEALAEELASDLRALLRMKE